jgi:mutator protein MutT
VRVRPKIQALSRRIAASERLNARSRIHVVAAAIEDGVGRTLIAQRPAGKHMAGAWEFPGGKRESGETPLQALARELREELGIEIGQTPPRPVRRINHSYPDRDVLIDVWRVQEFTGIPRGLDSQELRWCTSDELERAELLPADRPIVVALRLPDLLVEQFTSVYSIDKRQAGKQFGTWCDGADEALTAERASADFVLLSRSIPAAGLRHLCRRLSLPLFAMDVSLHDAWRMGASGIHKLLPPRLGPSA